MPLESHPDYGYGMMGSIYKSASDDITKVENYRKDWYSSLPVNYLRRHSIELFLKSGIILFHKKFKINFENDSCNSEPKVKLKNGKWELIRKTHNIGLLYQRMNELVDKHIDYLNKNTITVWKFDDDFEKWINTINGYDCVSDYFRYPITSDQHKDKRKSIFQENTMEGIQTEFSSGKKIMALIIENSQGDVTSIYNHNSAKMDELYLCLERASAELDGFHTAVRVELFKGF